MHPIREQFIKDMQAGGLSPASQKRYLKNVDLFFKATWQNPHSVTEQMVKDFMREVRSRDVARETFRGYLYALKFFFLTTMRRDWPSLKKTRFARPPSSV
jgi:site-specific recombinase XerD